MACELLTLLDAAAARSRRHLVPGQLQVVASFLERRHGGVRADGTLVSCDVFGAGALPVALIPKELVSDASQLRDAFSLTFDAVEELPPLEDFLGNLQLSNRLLLRQGVGGGTVVLAGEVSATSCDDAARVVHMVYSRGLLAKTTADEDSKCAEPAIAFVLSDAFCEAIVDAKLRLACASIAVVHLFSRRGPAAKTEAGEDHSEFFCAQPANFPLALFLFEALAVAPVILDEPAWSSLQLAWEASHRLLDVVMQLHSLLMPFSSSRVRKAHELGRPEDELTCTPSWVSSPDASNLLNDCYSHAHHSARGNIVAEAVAFATLYSALCTAESVSLLCAKVGPAVPSVKQISTDAQLQSMRLNFSEYVAALSSAGIHQMSFSPLVSPQVSLGRRLARLVARSIKHPAAADPPATNQVESDDMLDFFDPFVSDAVRVLYVLVSVSTARVTSQRWASFQVLSAVCCGGDDARMLAAIKELRVARLVSLNMSKRAARSLISI